MYLYYFQSYQQKTSSQVENTPSPYRVKNGIRERSIGAASQLPRQSANSDINENQERTAPVRINLPYVKGTSEQLKKSSMIITSIAHFTQLQHYVHFYHIQNILYHLSKETTSSINRTAKTVTLSILENQNKQLQRELKNTPEL